MAKTYPTITDELRDFINAQPMFFVATAPLDAGGHVNLSPKGLDCFRVLSPNHVAYLDLTGSGNETSAHLHENGRITFMFCAFSSTLSICSRVVVVEECCSTFKLGASVALCAPAQNYLHVWRHPDIQIIRWCGHGTFARKSAHAI